MNLRCFFATILFASVAEAVEPGWNELVLKSRDYMQAQAKTLEAEYGLSKHERWDLDQDKGELVFSSHGIPAVVAKFQFVGSVSTTSRTWLWSWANSSILPPLSQQVYIVRDYGQKHGFKKLTERKWDADEADGWEMAAVTNYLLKAQGVYRPPFKQGISFVVITELRKVNNK